MRPSSSTAAFYKLNRSGQFTVRTFGDNHCGTTDVLTIKYRLNVTCPARGLDARGFLFDQVKVNDWFQAQRSTDLSCENYAAHCGRALYREIRRENPGLPIDHLELELSPEPYAAAITFVWEAVEGEDGHKRAAATVTTKPVVMRAEQSGLDLTWGSLFA